jgi:hypothetical protein
MENIIIRLEYPQNLVKLWMFKHPSQKTLKLKNASNGFPLIGLTHKGYTLLCLRHTFASELLNASMLL